MGLFLQNVEVLPFLEVEYSLLGFRIQHQLVVDFRIFVLHKILEILVVQINVYRFVQGVQMAIFGANRIVSSVSLLKYVIVSKVAHLNQPSEHHNLASWNMSVVLLVGLISAFSRAHNWSCVESFVSEAMMIPPFESIDDWLHIKV